MTVSAPPVDRSAPAVDFTPPEIARRHASEWNGLRAEIIQVTRHEPFDYTFCGAHHLLIAAEQAERDDGETCVEGLPKSTLRKFSGKMTFVPAGHRFHGWQNPRVLQRSLYLFIDPQSLLLPPGIHFGEIGFKPRLFFFDKDLWETALKLKNQIENPSEPLYAEALETVLAHELVRMNSGSSPAEPAAKGGLAAWQQKRVTGFIEEHLSEGISTLTLADIAGLSPFHFSRMFKLSFGVPPHRYHLTRTVEHGARVVATLLDIRREGGAP